MTHKMERLLTRKRRIENNTQEEGAGSLPHTWLRGGGAVFLFEPLSPGS